MVCCPCQCRLPLDWQGIEGRFIWEAYKILPRRHEKLFTRIRMCTIQTESCTKSLLTCQTLMECKLSFKKITPLYRARMPATVGVTLVRPLSWRTPLWVFTSFVACSTPNTFTLLVSRGNAAFEPLRPNSDCQRPAPSVAIVSPPVRVAQKSAQNTTN